MSNLIRHTHSSNALAADFERWVTDSSLVTFTHVDMLPVRNGWTALMHDDCAGQAFNAHIYELVENLTARIAEGLDAHFVVLRHIYTGKVLLSGVAHFPSLRTRDLWPVSRGILREQAQIRKQFRCDGLVFTADWGINIKRRALRWCFAALFPKMEISFKPPLPREGTDESQINDFALVGSTMSIVQGPRILKRSGTRHAFRQVLAFRSA